MATHEPNQSCNKSGCYKLLKIVAESREYFYFLQQKSVNVAQARVT